MLNNKKNMLICFISIVALIFVVQIVNNAGKQVVNQTGNSNGSITEDANQSTIDDTNQPADEESNISIPSCH